MVKERADCPACQSGKTKPAYKINNICFRRCCNCGMVFLSQLLTERELKSIYDREDYQQFSYYVEGLEEKIARQRIDYLKKEGQLKKNMRVLDFGCSDGLFLAKLREFSPFLNLYGLDISETAVAKGKDVYRLNLIAGELKSSTFPKNYFDLVTSYHVFEHLQNPKEVLKKISVVTKRGGRIVITTPNEEYLLLKIFQILYRLSPKKLQSHLQKFYNREHINSFTEKSLKILLEKSGFKVMKVWQSERYFTKFCLQCFNTATKIVLRVLTYLSKVSQKEAEIWIIGEKI